MAEGGAFTLPENFGEELQCCSICFEPFKNPKVLPCSHVFCQECIGRHYDFHKLRNLGKVSCPTCREFFPLPSSGVSGFRSDCGAQKLKELIQKVNNTNNGHYMSDESRRIFQDLAMRDVAEKMDSIKSWQVVLQNELAKLREDLLQTCGLEVHIKERMRMECNAVLTGKKAKMAMKRDAREKYVENIRATHKGSLAQLTVKQERVYGNLVTLKCMHDLLEEIFQKVERTQLEYMADRLLWLLECMKKRFASNASYDTDLSCRFYGEEEGAVGGVGISEQELGIDYSSGEFRHARRQPAFPKPDLSRINSRFLYCISGRGKKRGCFDSPTHATFTPTGDIVVSDKNNMRIQVFDGNGNVKDVLLENQIKPRRARVNPLDGLLYVSDELAECVKVFTMGGMHVRRLGQVMTCPVGLDFDSRGNVVVSDAENSAVAIFQPQGGEAIMRMNTRSINDKQIPNPYFVTVNDEDNLLVADFRNNCIKIYNHEGKSLFRIEKLDCPRGICCDPYGNIFVAESDKHRISMYSPFGKFVQCVLTQKDGLNYPMSIDMNHEGKLVVSQCGPSTPHEVLVFQMYV